MKLLKSRKLGHAIKAMLAASFIGLPLLGCAPEKKTSTPEEIEEAVEKEKEISYREKEEG